MLTRSAVFGRKLVTPSQFGALRNNALVDCHDEIIAAYATGSIVKLDGWYRTTRRLDLPANSRTVCDDPANAGFILDMPADEGIVFGDGSCVSGLGAKSAAYPSSAITFDANYLLGRRGLVSGNNCQFGNVYMSDLAGGLDCGSKTGITLRNINGDNLRSRSGWTSVIHVAGGSNVVGAGIYGTDCDRFIELEAGTHDCSFATGAGMNIYPNGYPGQPDAGNGSEVYATYSLGLDVHAHQGEGGCHSVTFDGFTGTNCLNFIDAQRSTGSSLSDLSHDIAWSNITLNTPRTGNPVDLQGYNLLVENLTFDGTKNGALSRLLFTRSATGSGSIVFNNITVPDNYYGQPVAQFQGNGSKLTNSSVGTRSIATANPFYVYRVEANNCVLDGNFTKRPTYSTAVYYFAVGTSGNVRTNNTYTDASANDPGAVCSYNSTTVTESGNLDAAET